MKVTITINLEDKDYLSYSARVNRALERLLNEDDFAQGQFISGRHWAFREYPSKKQYDEYGERSRAEESLTIVEVTYGK